MFILRTHEPDARSIPRLISDLTSLTGDKAQPLHDEGQGRADRHAVPKSDTGRETPPAMRPGQPHRAPMQMPLFAAAFAVRFGGATAALECGKHLADVQALIDKVERGMVRGRDRLPLDMATLVDALLDDARMFLDAARENHARPRGPYDHARAFAKTDAALGHARAAEIVYSRGTQE